MALVIRDHSLGEGRTLKIERDGIMMLTAALFSSKKRAAFKDIDLIMRSKTGLLSIHYGRDAFKIKTSPTNKRHAEVIDALVRQVRATDL